MPLSLNTELISKVDSPVTLTVLIAMNSMSTKETWLSGSRKIGR
ncbi:hypothetical protein CUZ89_1835 [Enterococcus xinjiangensis]|nr:hypothetical protein [Enterococcus lactis]MBL4992003.1 hypothetical protein [Enterococcus lactis]MBL4999846.1 hypothetical protein [Enterococcus lactis]MBL5003652.1 hypothetical protein [Enterococcus lactis]MBL5015126.1 hypothetical protein [Enterococcus lactis]